VDRGGFTLLEVVLATALLAVGVLALASTARPVARLVDGGGAQSQVAAAAAARLEVLRATGCGDLRDGDTVVAGRYRLHWTVGADGPLRPVTVFATYPWAGADRLERFDTSVACSP
jgi:prepilin-type N-terminal cleavage/methylation domain-containing protein